jgi:hypothetical protein
VDVTFIQRSAVAAAAAVAIAAVLAAAFGATAGPGTVAAGPPPTSTGRSLLLTTSNDGTSLKAQPGELVIVRLLGRGSMRWSTIQVSQTGAVLVRNSGSLSEDGTSTAVFDVAHDGTARLSAAGRPNCSPDVPCPQYIVLWRASVNVTD